MLGVLYGRELGDINKSIENFEKAEKCVFEKKASYYKDLGVVYGLSRKFDKSISALEKAIELEPDDDLTHTNIGHSYMNVGNREKAFQNFDTAISILNNKLQEPDLAEDQRKEAYEHLVNTYNILWNSYIELRNYEKAIQALENVIDIQNKMWTSGFVDELKYYESLVNEYNYLGSLYVNVGNIAKGQESIANGQACISKVESLKQKNAEKGK